MKKNRPFRMVFLAVQFILFLAVTLLPGYLTSIYARTTVQDQPLLVIWIGALLLLLADSIWVSVVLRRYYLRHDERSPWPALLVWGGYLILMIFSALFHGDYLAHLRPGNAEGTMTLLNGLLMKPVLWLIPAGILWLPALLASFSHSNDRYCPKKAFK